MTGVRRAAAPVPVLHAELPGRIAGFPVVSCDVFDTALLRRLARPEDVLLAVGARARARGLIGHAPEAFREYRLEAERAARAAAEAAGHDEPTLTEVYDRLPALGLVADPAAAAAVAALELATERDVLVPAEPLRAALAARAPGQRLIFVSDTLLPGAWLADRLREAGYGSLSVLTSADARRSKHTGRLFAHLLAMLGCGPGEVVHLGDNPVSDVARAREHGIAALYLPRRGRPPEPERLRAMPATVRLAHSGRRALAPPVPPAEPLTGPGVPRLHRYLTVLLVGFTLFILAEARRRGIRRLYFLSRDGHLPFLIARRLVRRLTDGPELAYLHVSRRSIVLPMEEDPLRLAGELAAAAEGRPLRDALEPLGIGAAVTAGRLRALGLAPDAPLPRREAHDALRRLIEAERGLVQDALRARRAGALAYLDGAGFLVPGPRMIVDVGWRGTTQEALARLTGLPDEAIAGCYLGLRPEALRPALNPRNAAGYLFAFGHPRPLMDLVLDGYIVLELLFSSPETTVLHYETRAGGTVPVHGTEPAASPRRRAAEALEAGCLAEFDALDAVLDGAWPEEIDPAAALLDLERLLVRPSRREVAEVNRIPFVQGVAGTGHGTAVRPVPWREWLLRPRGTLRRLERAAWRGGAVRTSLPWPIPSMTYAELRYRADWLLRRLGTH